MSETSLSLKAFAAQSGVRRAAPIEPRLEEEAEYQAFAYGRVCRKPELMIEFRKADGSRLALPYIELREIETSDPEAGFRLLIAQRKITVEGSRLEACYRFLKQNRIAELIEADRPTAMSAGDHEPIITSLRVQKARESTPAAR